MTQTQAPGLGATQDEHLEALGILVSCLDVMNGAGADDHEQAMVLAVENVAYYLATMRNGL